MSFVPKKCFVIVGDDDAPSTPFLTEQEAEDKIAEWCEDIGITTAQAKGINAARVEKALLVPDEG